MEWNWKIRELMKQVDIRQTSTLEKAIKTEIKRTCPNLQGAFTNATLNRMLDGTLIEMKASGIVSICRYFQLASISQLVDFKEAPTTPDSRKGLAIELEFRLRKTIQEFNLYQNQVRDRSRCSPSTLNGLYHGRHSTINFQVLKRIAEAIQELGCRDLQNCRLNSITNLIEIVTEDKLTTLSEERLCYERQVLISKP